MSENYLTKNMRESRPSISVPLSLGVLLFFALVLLGSPGAAHAQGFTFEPEAKGDSISVTINLAANETIEVHESHDMGGDGNRGTNLKVTYLNSSGQELFTQTFWGFFAATNQFPSWTPEPFPWLGSRASVVLPYTLKIESVDAYGRGGQPSPPQYNFTYSKGTRSGYNVGGDSFGNAPSVSSFPATYQGSVRDGRTATPLDPGQYFKVHLKCKQAMYVYGSATGHATYGANFKAEVYDSAQQLVKADWVATTSRGAESFTSTPFVNNGATDADFYIRVWSYNWPVYDFTLNINLYNAGGTSSKPVAPDATGTVAAPNSQEYHLPTVVDPDILLTRPTELWAKLYWPSDFTGGPYPLVVFLHGNHGTCGRTGTSPRVDDNASYTVNGTCPTGFEIVQNHLGYEYLATQLASRGYIVASINANRSITAANESLYPDDPQYIYARGRLTLKHLQKLSEWNSGPLNFITGKTLGTVRNNLAGWMGMKITTGSQPITVRALGRIFVSGNTDTHTVKIVRVSDNVTMGSVSLPMTGGTAGQFKYLNLASPVTLAANTAYYVASQEVKNGDSWYDSNTTVTSTTAATVNGRVTSSNGTTWSTTGAVPGNVYVPVDLKYDTQVLGVNLAGKIDFSNVGLMGHSRGGLGVRAAYNLYRDPSIDSRGTIIPWSTRIPGLSIKGIFEIAPTDTPLPTSSTGSGNRYLNADGTKWNVLLPMCDGDVLNLQGVRAFDRMMAYTGTYPGLPADSPATQKSTYTVWGANHNFYNTEWQQNDTALAVCQGDGNTQLYTLPVTNGNGSPTQRTTGSASLLAFFRANVGAAASPTFNQNFNPRYALPSVVTSVTRVEQGFTASPNLSMTKILYDFPPSGLPPETSFETNNVTATNGVISDHDYTSNIVAVPEPSPVAQKLTVGKLSWSSAACDTYFQANWRNPGTGDFIGGYQSLDFRISRQNNTSNPSGATNFQIVLVMADGSTSGAVSLNKYAQLLGPVGRQDWQTLGDGRHSILQTVRIPLTDFPGANLSQVRGVRFIFSDTPTGAINLAHIRLSNQP